MKNISTFIKMAWKTSPAYVLIIILNAFISGGKIILNTILPMFLIDELLGGREVDKLVLYGGIIVLNNVFMSFLSSSNFLTLIFSVITHASHGDDDARGRGGRSSTHDPHDDGDAHGRGDRSSTRAPHGDGDAHGHGDRSSTRVLHGDDGAHDHGDRSSTRAPHDGDDVPAPALPVQQPEWPDLPWPQSAAHRSADSRGW